MKEGEKEGGELTWPSFLSYSELGCEVTLHFASVLDELMHLISNKEENDGS